jgi:hypothetical protein
MKEPRIVKLSPISECVDSSWNVMAHGDAREGKWRGNWRIEWVTSTLHTTLEHGVSSITTADAHTSAASSRLNWRPLRFKWTRPFCRKMKSGFCACAITFQLASTVQGEGRTADKTPQQCQHSYKLIYVVHVTSWAVSHCAYLVGTTGSMRDRRFANCKRRKSILKCDL